MHVGRRRVAPGQAAQGEGDTRASGERSVAIGVTPRTLWLLPATTTRFFSRRVTPTRVILSRQSLPNLPTPRPVPNPLFLQNSFVTGWKPRTVNSSFPVLASRFRSRMPGFDYEP